MFVFEYHAQWNVLRLVMGGLGLRHREEEYLVPAHLGCRVAKGGAGGFQGTGTD